MSERKISFGKVFWPSLVAALIVSVLGSIIFVLIVGGFINGLSDFKTESIALKDKTVLHLTLDGDIAERSSSKFVKSQLSFNNNIGLSDLLFGFEKASKDEKIAGIFVDLKGMNCGYSTAKELRNAINDFEKSGKFVVAYNSGEMISQKEYYVASAANLNYAFPTSALEFRGLGAELMYFKKTLDKLDVEIQVIRGKNNDFKSAVEPFFRESMSDSSRVQVERYLNGLWLSIRTDISKDRKISIDKLDEVADGVLVHRAEDAVQYNMIDKVKYRDEVIEDLKVKAGSRDELNLFSFEKYAKKKFKQDQILNEVSDPNIAVILAEGEISTEGDGLTSKEICKLFQDVRKNKSIKTVVFRINSPGGSALASDEIWREVKLTNKVKKVIVSMGDVAASGGYYIAAPAARIFAEETTITGSIGVFGVIPFTGNMLTNKLGLTFDRASTNKHSVLTLNKKLTDDELSFIQEEVDQIYDEFLKRVSEGRGMSKEAVNRVARGRVWTGKDALKYGLVDEIGGLKASIAYAAKNASLSDPTVLYYPLQKEDVFEEMLEKIQDEEFAQTESNLGVSEDLKYYYEQLKQIDKLNGIQMRLPFYVKYN